MAELNLSEYTASGIYTIEVDGTQTLSFPLNSGRLVIGTSRVGPINSLVLVRDPQVSQYVYGPRDMYLENRGNYFHKALEVMLGLGPVYALNLVPIDLEAVDANNLDQANFTAFSTDSSFANMGVPYANLGTEPTMVDQSAYKNFFNRQKFWSASDERLTATKNTVFAGADKNSILSFVNLSKRQVTVFIKRGVVNGFDATVEEWYKGLGTDVVVPTYLHKDDLISDYFVDVTVVEGDWSDSVRLSQDVKFGRFFNSTGLEIAMMDEFLNNKEVKRIARVTGSLIADFEDRSGNNIAIDKVFNRMFAATELIMALDEENLETIDLTQETFNESTMATHRVEIIGHGALEFNGEAACDAVYTDDKTELVTADKNPLIDMISYRKPVSPYLVFLSDGAGTTTSDTYFMGTTSITEIRAYQDSKLYKAWASGFVYSGMRCIEDGGTPGNDIYIKVDGPYAADLGGTPAVICNYISIKAYSDISLLNTTDFNVAVTGYDEDAVIFVDDETDYYYSKVALTTDWVSWAYTQPNVIEVEVLAANVDAAPFVEYFTYLTPGNYIKAKTTSGRTRMLKILSVAKNTTKSTLTNFFYTITVMSAKEATVQGIDMGTVGSETIFVAKGIPNFVEDLRGFTLDGFSLRAATLPDGTATRQSTILKYLFDSGLYRALIQSDAVDIRQIVDSYEGTIEPSSKYYLVKLAASHARSSAFVNDPSMKQFEDSVDPSFIDAVNGLVNPQYIVDGGDLSLNPSYTFTLPEETLNGTPMESFAYFVMPYLMIRDRGKNKRMISAPYMANAYYRKFQGGNRYGITAGLKGKITEPEVIGPEYDFDDEARKILEPKGHNLIVKRKRHGIMLLSNNTAYYKIESALNSAHVRENLISVENDIDAILFGFLYDFNDPITRIRVKTQIENYLDGVKSSRGITWYNVIIDETNNTEELISKNIALVDIQVNFTKGIHKFINRITLTKSNGQISPSQTGFTFA